MDKIVMAVCKNLQKANLSVPTKKRSVNTEQIHRRTLMPKRDPNKAAYQKSIEITLRH